MPAGKSYLVLVAWGVIILVFSYPALTVYDSINNQNEPHILHDLAPEERIVKQVFGQDLYSSVNPIVVLLSGVAEANTIKDSDLVRNFSLAVQQTAKTGARKTSVHGYYIDSNSVIRNAYVAGDQHTVIIINPTHDHNHQSTHQLLQALRQLSTEWKQGLEGNYEVRLGGNPAFAEETVTQAALDAKWADAITIPIALLVLVYAFGNFRLLVLPMATMLATSIVSLGFASLLARGSVCSIDAFSISTSMCLCIALNIDYSLLLMHTYLDSSKVGTKDPWQRILQVTGRTIITSSAAIFLALTTGLLFYQENQYIGMGAVGSVTVMVAAIASLTIIPAAMKLLGTRLVPSLPSTTGHENDIYSAITTDEVSPSFSINKSTEDGASPYGNMDASANTKKQSTSFFVRIGTLVERYPIQTLIVASCIGFAFLPVFLHFHTEHDLNVILPTGTPAREALELLMERWGIEHVYPHFIVIHSPHRDVRKDEAYWQSAHHLILSMNRTLDIPITAWKSVVAINGTLISALQRELLLASSDDWGEAYQMMWHHSVAKNGSTMLLGLDPGFASTKYLGRVKTIKQYLQQYGWTINDTTTDYYLYGLYTRILDNKESLERLMGPTYQMLLFGMGCLIFVTYKSAVLPLISIACAVYTLMITLSIFQMIFGGMMYATLPVAIAIMSALTVDYGVFMLSGIRGYRAQGFTNAASQIKAIQKVGPIISAAGIIMTIAFVGLTQSSFEFVQEFGLVMSVSIIIDATIVRCLFMPSLMILLGDVVWWPCKMPNACKYEDEMSEDEFPERAGKLYQEMELEIQNAQRTSLESGNTSFTISLPS